ncbi:phytanoyl-CoA dioxygenase family protein [Alteromonas lipolytica]|uniref:Phytanoyl-CoA dioxygenase n=1 Tax=Alteromonas lipolytica TaxID=1856405 RepID=A0A1E8FAY0_9ALTE|nr:phytanoyl-CoA dioxygenase family protein [Alteromonas lipolytica]OFI32936.1 hypothetical protein BFC17_01270 [Alteromonas lipolytica]GGF64095.1 phytanoyl-CoA dioxygenase [Alteromonas lipolytica]
MTDITTEILAKAAQEYAEYGATVLRQVIPLAEVDRLGSAVDAMMNKGEKGNDDRSSGGRFFRDIYTTLYSPEFNHFVTSSGLAAIAGSVMRSQQVHFFYDQLLVKEPSTPAATPWHQDLPYWPASGENIISTWVPMDPATPESGVVTYVKGSHRWNKFFPTQPFTAGPDDDLAKSWQPGSSFDRPDGPGKMTLKDVRDHPEHYEFLSWSVEPGDVILHHPLIVHGAPGNQSTNQRRRALALRWFGDDARWDVSRPNFMKAMCKRDNLPYPELDQGQKITSCPPFFPLVWEA